LNNKNSWCYEIEKHNFLEIFHCAPDASREAISHLECEINAKGLLGHFVLYNIGVISRFYRAMRRILKEIPLIELYITGCKIKCYIINAPLMCYSVCGNYLL